MRAYLEVIHNPGDSVRLRRIINNPARKIGLKTMELVAQLAEQQRKTEFEIIRQAAQYPALARSSGPLEKFAAMIDGLRALEKEVPLAELYQTLLERSGYLAALELQGTDEARGRIENIQELRSNIADYCQRMESGEGTPSLEGFLEELSLISDVDQYDENADTVTMMTMHSAKGLEFPQVFIVGAEEGLFPSYRAMENEEEMEEERRLCYVAMTRAKRSLTITCSQRRMLYGQTTYGRPSRFVAEIPEELVEQVSRSGSGRDMGSALRQASQQRQLQLKQRIRAESYQPQPAADLDFKPGMQVLHKAFGPGRILETTPMGGDLLLNIRFEKAGDKLMMAKTASRFMKKL